MQTQILDGKQVAQQRRRLLAEKIAQRTATGLPPPGLAVIMLGNDPASEIYVANKRRACAEIGIVSFAYDLPASTSQEELINLILQLNEDERVHGILVQLPLPKHIDEELILETMRADKDVDGFHPYNIGRLVQRRPLLRPSTPLGITILLNYYQIPLKGVHAVVVGASNIVGRPMSLELLLAGSTVTTCHKFTTHLASHVKMADILIVAIGKAGIVQSEWIKPGAVVIDVGITRRADGTLHGDIDFATAQGRAGWLTPVPGGVGPMTILGLLENTFLAATHEHYDNLFFEKKSPDNNV